MSSQSLVLGASGFLGSYFCYSKNAPLQQFRKRTNQDINSKIYIDPWDFNQMQEAVTVHNINSIVNCIAVADIDLCEKDPEIAFKVNSVYPYELAKFCRDTGIYLVHVSTDSVLEDDNSLKSEMSPTSPKSIYGKSKLKGEEAVRSISSNFAVARVNFYGSSPKKNSLFDYFYNSLSSGLGANGFSDVTFSPLYVLDTVEALMLLVERKFGGLIHLGGSQSITKYDFAIEVAKHLKIEPELITESSIKSSPMGYHRGLNLAMDNKKMLEIYEPKFSLSEGIIHSITKRERADL